MTAVALLIGGSVALQVAAGFLALRLIRVTGAGRSWWLIAGGLWGMAFRRVFSLERVVSAGTVTRHDGMFEALGFATSALMVAGVFFIEPVFAEARRAKERAEEVARDKERLAEDLAKALASIKVLAGIVPICSGCKAIRDEAGRWQPLEEYMTSHTEADFSHGLCPDCIDRLYPDLARSKPTGAP